MIECYEGKCPYHEAQIGTEEGPYCALDECAIPNFSEKDRRYVMRLMYWGAGALLILLLLLYSVRIYKLPETPPEIVEPIQWDCLPGHGETPPPMPSH